MGRQISHLSYTLYGDADSGTIIRFSKGGKSLVQPMNFLYTYTCHEDELSLCQLEMRSLFGYHTESSILESSVEIDPSRSPFINERIDIFYKASCFQGLVEKVKGMIIAKSTFKVIFVENKDLPKQEKIDFEERRKIEREIGLNMIGKVELVQPDLLFAIMKLDDDWIFGRYTKSKSVWFFHQKKPNNYSTALSTRVARAVVNIAVPTITPDINVIDPCSGAGTVLIEALSMGINIVGSDLNPLVNPIARENIAYFGFKGEVTLRDIRDVTGYYDVAIIDMPYNLCSVLDPKVQLEMLQSARKFAGKVVIITIDTIDSLVEEALFKIVDRCVAKKGNFTRQILVCE